MTAAQDQAAAANSLQELFDRQVAEAMPAAFNHAVRNPVTMAGWLYRAVATDAVGLFGPLDKDADLLFVGSLSVPSLLVLMFDKRQPAEVVLAARDAMALHYLADPDVKRSIVETAERRAREAIQRLSHLQAAARAEHHALYGHEVPGVPPTVLLNEQVAAMDEAAGLLP